MPKKQKVNTPASSFIFDEFKSSVFIFLFYVCAHVQLQQYTIQFQYDKQPPIKGKEISKPRAPWKRQRNKKSKKRSDLWLEIWFKIELPVLVVRKGRRIPTAKQGAIRGVRWMTHGGKRRAVHSRKLARLLGGPPRDWIVDSPAAPLEHKGEKRKGQRQESKEEK